MWILLILDFDIVRVGYLNDYKTTLISWKYYLKLHLSKGKALQRVQVMS